MPLDPNTPPDDGRPMEAKSPRRVPVARLAVIGGVVLAVVIVGIFVLRALTASVFDGSWYGTGLISGANGSQAILSGEYAFYLSLTQNGDVLSGTGQVCYNTAHGIHPAAFTVTGTAQGRAAHLFVHAADKNNIDTGNTPLNATVSSSAMTLTFVDPAFSFTATLHQGTQDQFGAACRALPHLAGQ